MPIWIIAKYEILRFMRMRYVLVIQFLMPLLTYIHFGFGALRRIQNGRSYAEAR